MPPSGHVQWGWLLVLGLVYAAVQDLRTRRVSNALSAALALAGLAAWLLAAGPGGLAISIGGLGGALGVGLIAFAGRALGGGDAKLLAASGAWVSVGRVPALLAFTALAGGAMVLLYRGRAARVPYAPAIAVGAAIAFFGGPGS